MVEDLYSTKGINIHASFSASSPERKNVRVRTLYNYDDPEDMILEISWEEPRSPIEKLRTFDFSKTKVCTIQTVLSYTYVDTLRSELGEFLREVDISNRIKNTPEEA